ncbi:MAG: hypothetical protein M0042_03620 [Nitrospiraceae bacterium]|nr:hypothetical protein [Nitrospiraceae bacterium]
MRTAILVLVSVVIVLGTGTVFAMGGGDITFKLKNADNVIFSHDYHLKLRGLKCAACHFQKFAKGQGYEMKKESITKRDFCEHCHNGMKGFDVSNVNNCVRCHKK